MRGKRMVGLLMLVSLLTACTPQSLGEAIQTDIPFNIEKIIHTEKVEDGEIILYITEQKSESEIEAMAVAFMKKDGKSGWENAGNNHWYHDDKPNMTVFVNTFYDYDKKGNLDNRIPVIFGKIKNNQIQSVQITEEKGRMDDAQIIHADGARYYMNIGDYLLVKGLNGQGEVVEEYEKRD